MLRLTLAVGAVLAVAASAAAAGGPYVIRGDTKVGGLTIGRSGTAAAQARSGTASKVHAIPGGECTMAWEDIGLTLDFIDLSTKKGCKNGVLLRATVRSRAAWRTGVGLRVGDTAARVKSLYPKAKLHSGGADRGYWLIVRNACEEAGGFAYPGLLARVGGGKVTALVAGTTACE